MLAFAVEDRPLIARIYESKKELLGRYAYSVLKDEQEAADVVQQSVLDFMEAFHRLSHLSEDKLCGYLFSITRNNVYDECKRRNKLFPSEWMIDEADPIDTEEVALTRVGIEDMKKAIRHLPPRYGSYLQMVYLDKLDREVVARALGVKPDSLRMIDVRAKKLLKALLLRGEEV